MKAEKFFFVVLIAVIVSLVQAQISEPLTCEQLAFTTTSQSSCIYPLNGLQLVQFPHSDRHLINVSSTTIPTSISTCLSHSIDGDRSVCSALRRSVATSNEGINNNNENTASNNNDYRRTVPRYANRGIWSKQQRMAALNNRLSSRYGSHSVKSYEEISRESRGTPAGCYATVAFQWQACNVSAAIPSPLDQTTINMCEDFQVPEIARFPSGGFGREENVTCDNSGDCFCMDFPSPSDFGLSSFDDGVAIGLVLIYIDNSINQDFFGLAYNISCTGYPCIPVIGTTTGIITNNGTMTTTTGNPTNGTIPITTVVIPITADESSSSSDLALILGLALGLGIPFVLCCILLIIAAIIGLLFLLGKFGKRPTAKTFWVPSRDDL